MTLLHRLASVLRWLVYRNRAEQELSDELQAFVDMAAADIERDGTAPAEARRLAVLQLGGVEQVKERIRTTRPGWWLDEAGRDVRYSVRLLRRRPVLSATAILTLMFGIGGTTAVFSLLDALLMKDLPVAKPQELVRLVEPRPDGNPAEAFTLITHDTLQRSSKLLSGVIASSQMVGRPGEIEVGGQIRRAFVQLVSDNYFDVLGVAALRGRVFHQPTLNVPAEPIAVISEEYWQRQYGGDVSVLGTTVRQGTREFTIAGITPAGFRGTEIDVPVDIWVSIEHVVPPNAPDRTRGRWMRVMGRLQAGITPAQAEAETSALLGRRAVQFQPGGIGYSTLRSRLYQPLVVVAVVTLLVLLIACANLANLMLAATASRDREIALRGAIGASRGRIIRQLLTESLVLALLGGMLGLGVAILINGALLAFLPPQQAIAAPNLRLVIDTRVLGLVILLSCGTCLVFGVLPALRVTGNLAAGALKTGARAGRRRRSMLSGGLLVGQVVMCTALLIVAGVFIRTLANLRGQEAGYREERLIVADVEFPRNYAESRRDQLIAELRDRASALPGVQVAAFSHVGQLSGMGIEFRIGFPGRDRPEADETVLEQRISPGFFSAMGTPLVVGREFRPSDDGHAPLVAIVNESFAHRFLPEGPIGARFYREIGSGSGELMEIVGLVKDSKWINLRDDSAPMYYRPYGQMNGTPMVRFAIRTADDPRLVARELMAVAQSVDKQMVLSNVVPFREMVDRTLVTERLVAHVASAFGVLALGIAAVGLYGVLAYNVARRRREIGLRIAIGAQRRSVEKMFLGESLTSLALGIAIGIPLAILGTRLASSMLFGIGPHDPTSIGGALAALTITTVTAAYLPARAAARTDPAIALREE